MAWLSTVGGFHRSDDADPVGGPFFEARSKAIKTLRTVLWERDFVDATPWSSAKTWSLSHQNLIRALSLVIRGCLLGVMQPNNHVWSLTGLDLLLACVTLRVVKMMLGTWLVYVFRGVLDIIFYFTRIFFFWFLFLFVFFNHIEKFYGTTVVSMNHLMLA